MKNLHTALSFGRDRGYTEVEGSFIPDQVLFHGLLSRIFRIIFTFTQGVNDVMVKPIAGFDAELESAKELAAQPLEVSKKCSEAATGEKKGEVSSKQMFKLPLSRALARKVQQKAVDEGVAPEELLCELVAEGLVLRAWEIMERKSTMRGGRPQNFNQKGGNRYREQKNRRSFNRGNRAEKGTAILEDRAAFLEYVRSQEKGNK